MWKSLAKIGGSAGPPNKAALSAAGLVLGGTAFSVAAYKSVFTVEGGQRAVMFNRYGGVSDRIYKEGTHFCLPYFQEPTIFDIRTKPKTIRSPTGTRDLQMVDITLRVLYKPAEEALPEIFSQLSTNYDERVLPSIVNETLKGVIAQFNASQLITQREQVSRLVRRNLGERARDFHIIVDDVSITHLTFGTEYTAAIEAKQVAQQEAERAKFLVKQAMQDKRSTIIKAKGEAEAALLIGEAIRENPGYVTLRQLEAAKDISQSAARGGNRLYLDSDSLLLNINTQSSSAGRLSAK